jgi:predicted AAA+ superfamily ATPase
MTLGLWLIFAYAVLAYVVLAFAFAAANETPEDETLEDETPQWARDGDGRGRGRRENLVAWQFREPCRGEEEARPGRLVPVNQSIRTT